MPHLNTVLLVFAAIFLIVGIVRLIKPDLGWQRKINRWADVDGDVEPSKSYLLRSRIVAIVMIVFAVVMFFAGFNMVR